MISPEIMQQGKLLLHAMALGVILIFSYDLLRIFRRGIRHGTVGIAVEDMLFWMCSVFFMFQLMYEENDGKVRWFVIMGAMLGMILYNVSLSKWIVSAGSIAFRGFLRVIRGINGKIVKIMRNCMKPFACLGKCSGRISKKSNRYIKKQLKKLWKTVKIGLYKL